MSPRPHRDEDTTPPLNLDRLRITASSRNSWLIAAAIFTLGAVWADLKSDNRQFQSAITKLITTVSDDHDRLTRLEALQEHSKKQ